MNSMTASRSLFIANPFWDKMTQISEDFLKQNNIVKNETKVEFDEMRVAKLWQQVKNSEGKMKGRCGGSGATLLLPFVKLSRNFCSILGRIGNDKYGKKIETHLNDLHVNSLLIKSKKDHPTGKVICMMTPDGERTMLAHLGTTVEFNSEDIIQEQLQDYDHWHIEGYAFYFGLFPKCLQIASERKNKPVISMNLPTQNVVKELKSQFQQHLSHFHYIFGNVEEVQTLTDTNDIHKAFAHFGIDQTVIATDGANGCWVKAQGQTEAVHYPAIKVEKVVNKTGAGDIWSGIYLALALQGKRVETCVEMANRGAADWIQQKPGTYIEERTWEIFRKEIALKS